MKAYAEYMDSITVDASLHAAILRQAQSARAKEATKWVVPAARMVTAAAVIGLCVFAAPLLLNRWDERQGEGGKIAQDAVNRLPDGVETLYPSLDAAADTGTQPGDAVKDSNMPPVDVPLVLNENGSQLAALIHIPGHFWYDLTGAQYDALLPALAFPVDATVHYRGDGTVFSVVLYEIDNGETARFDEKYTRTEIVLAPGAVVDCVTYDFTPAVTMIDGVEVVTGVFDYRTSDGVAYFTAEFKMDNVAYAVRLHDSDEGTAGVERLTAIVNAIIRFGAADMAVLADPVVPELRDEARTLSEAYADPDFGVSMPLDVPGWLGFEDARRFVNQVENSLSANWRAGYDYLSWRVAAVREADWERVVSPGEREKYDLALYPIPRADSVPDVLWEVVNDPIFRAEEITLDMLCARAYRIADAGGTPGWRLECSVLAGDVVIRIVSKGPSPEEIWAMLAAVRP